jgi:HIRAN domain
MEVIAVGLVVTVLAGIFVAMRQRRSTPPAGTQQVTVNYLIPDKDDDPLTPQEVFVAGVNHVALCGKHRQKIIAKLRRNEPIFLVRVPDHPDDPNAVVLFRADGNDIGYLPRELAEEIAPRLDAGSPVTATVSCVEPFETEEGRHLLGVRLWIIRYRLRRQSASAKAL